ncbi:MAG: hypothetical protein K8H89_14700, partial [Flavobacteriales bacterium]|nr:hypothetical protein [Flavobacteriales bacterium]
TLRPCSCSRSIATICASVHLLFLIVPKFRLILRFYYPAHLILGELTRSPYEASEALQESLALYWLAFKAVLPGDLQDNIAINLANHLISLERRLEAIQFLDQVLRRSPAFPQALVSRADALWMLPIFSNGGLSASLIAQLYNGYRSALHCGPLPSKLKQHCELRMQQALTKLKSFGFDLPDLERELSESLVEFQSLSEQRRFSIENFLTLNEHAIYCSCDAAKWDDLQIGSSRLMLLGPVVPRLELLLNRVKSEYSLARWMYFKSAKEENDFTLDAKFSELFEGESLEPATEMLRSSYRQCYGILDKLAEGICQLYSIQPKKKVYFATIWDQTEVKEKFFEIKNNHLTALVSIACDLKEGGELCEFKTWRNKMEHGLFMLIDNEQAPLDPLGLLDDESIVSVDLEVFRDKALHLLQLTRAAIMSFTYCVRLQTVVEDVGSAKPIVIDFRR